MFSHHLVNPFDSERLSNDNFDKFSSIHIERLTAGVPQNGNTLYGVPVQNIFNTMITDTQACYNIWKTTAATKATESSTKEGKTINVDDAISDMKEFISFKEGVIADRFHPGTPTYEEFFPNGKSEYSHVTKKNAEKLFKRFITTLDNHKTSFDEIMLTEANDKYNAYTSFRKDQLQTISKVNADMTDSDDKRYKLSSQLYKNLLTLLLINAEEPDKAANYFDESMFKKKGKKDEPPTPPQA